MTDPLIGERMTNPPRYIDHPPVASSLLANGKPIDAGTEMILRNDLAHCAEESLRHLVTDGNPQFDTKGSTTTDGWDGLSDASRPTGGGGWASDGTLISWDQRVALSYGPLNLIPDHTITATEGAVTGTTGGRTIRKMRVRIEANFAHIGDTIYVALTCGEGQTPADGIIAGCFATYIAVAASTIYVTLDLACGALAESLATTHAPCRPGGTSVHGASDISTIMGFLWVGRNAGVSVASSITIYSVSCWEIL